MRDEPMRILRRTLLQRSVLTAAGISFIPTLLPSLLRAQPAGASDATARPARAKAVIQVWLWGGACHIDTFDPKPEAGRDYCGALEKAISTNVDGIRIGELLPLLARQADQYALVRSMTHGNNGHETASYLVQTGRASGERLVYPCVGAVVSRLKGYDAGYRGLIPPYVVLTSPLGRFSEAGFLGPRYKPFATGGDPAKARFAVEGIVAEGITEQRQRARRELLHQLDTLGRAMPGNPVFEQLDRCEDNAYGVILGDTARLFDLDTEKADLRDRYGRNTFGQSCLMARRLVAAGIQFVSINYRGWDTHKQHFETMRRKLPELDQGLATLLADLRDHGLLDSTIVWCCGEFGRTPRVQWEAPWNGGRGHHGDCFSALLAGGGFKGGRVVGASDKRGEKVADRPVYPHDVIGSIYELLGIDPDGPMPHPGGLAVRMTPGPSDGATGLGRLKEIM